MFMVEEVVLMSILVAVAVSITVTIILQRQCQEKMVVERTDGNW